MPKRENTEEYSFQHTKERMLERYGLEITQADWQAMGFLCKAKKWTILTQEHSNHQIIADIRYKGHPIIVVWDYENNWIKTVLPRKVRVNFKERQKRIGLDFDGVLHSYTSGYTGFDPVDPPVEGAVAFVNWLVEQNYEIHIFTARLSQLSDINKDIVTHRMAINKWLIKWGFPADKIKTISGQKPAADVFIDDNGYRFDGDFSKVISGINTGELLRPWYKQNDLS